MTTQDCAVMCNLIKHTHTVLLIPPWEDRCEWHRMTWMTGPDCAVMCNLINTHTHTLKKMKRNKNASSLHNPILCCLFSSRLFARAATGGRRGTTPTPEWYHPLPKHALEKVKPTGRSRASQLPRRRRRRAHEIWK